MSIFWTAPAALMGMTLVVLPIAVHLLARHHLRTLPYPSLRFLRQTQLASFRRRTLEDVLLLACRVAIVAAAAAALAGPLFETPSRLAGYSGRLSRAIVISEPAPAEIVTPLEQGVFRSVRVQRASIGDALADAVRWLDQQPRSSREVVIVGALRRGSIEPSDLAVVPGDAGIRFAQTATDGPGETAMSILTRRNGELIRIERTISLTSETTRVMDGAASPAPANLAVIVTRPGDAALGNAALRAALDAGVPWRNFDKRAALVWSGGDESTIDQGVEIVRMPVPDPPASAADVVWHELAKIGAPARIEPLTIPATQLDAWSRPPGPPPVDAPRGDDSDRRWIWALVLALIGVESWLRRIRPERAAASSPSESEARVA